MAKEELINRMVDRFLCWKLPKNFAPDCGISFNTQINGQEREWETSWWPVGTNLFDAAQAKEMIEWMLRDEEVQP